MTGLYNNQFSMWTTDGTLVGIHNLNHADRLIDRRDCKHSSSDGLNELSQIDDEDFFLEDLNASDNHKSININQKVSY